MAASTQKEKETSMRVRIEVKNLQYSIDGIKIIESVSLSVRNNHTVGIIGPNGSGKTTLLKHLYRALPVAPKTVYIDGQEIEKYSYMDTAKRVTVVKQENSSDFDFTVMGMVLLGRSPYRRCFESFSKEDREIAHSALASIGMLSYAERSFNSLSGGEKQRVLIARSLAQQADIYILDEPTNHLDIHYQWNLMDLIKKTGATVLGVFHEMNLAASYCDELIVLAEGNVVAHGAADEILTSDLLADIFGVRAEVIKLKNGRPHIIIHGQVQSNNG